MSESDQAAQITQLQQQQALMTQALVAALQGKWTGAGSVEALVYALDPGLTGTLEPLDIPVTESELDTLPKG
ncbi:MAG TPA: hypothetical protein VFB50_15990 [Chloroflexota bacterium]|nr:hypothetical protein [Chloroflexota bacterium]